MKWWLTGCGQWGMRKRRTIDNIHTPILGVWKHYGGNTEDWDSGVRGTGLGKKTVLFFSDMSSLKCLRDSQVILLGGKNVASDNHFLLRDGLPQHLYFFFAFLESELCCCCCSQASSSASMLQGWKKEKVLQNQSRLPYLLLASTPVVCPSKVMSSWHAIIWRNQKEPRRSPVLWHLKIALLHL